MAFVQANLERLSGGLKQHFAYQTTDAIATVVASGYFNTATSRLRQFDTISVVASTGGTPTIDLIFVTSASEATTVTTSGTEGITAT